MLDKVLIFTKTGVVLWSLSFLPPSRDGSDPTAPAVEALCRDVLVPQLPDSSLAYGGHVVKWSQAVDFDIVVAAVFARAVALGNIEMLLLATQRTFVSDYRDKLAARGYVGGVDDGFDFDDKFNALLDAWERKRDGAGGSGRPSPVKPAPARPSPKAPAVVELPIEPADDGLLSTELASADDVAAARARLSARGVRGGPGRTAASQKKAAVASPAKAAPAGKPGKPGALAPPGSADFKFSAAAAATLDRSAARGSEADVTQGVVEVKFSGVGAGRSGRDLDDDDGEAGGDWASAALDAAAAEGSAAGGAAASAAGGSASSGGSGAGGVVGAVSSWFTRSTVGSFLTSLAGSRVLDAEDVAPVMASLRDQLISKNVTSEVAAQICEGVAAQLVGQHLDAVSSVAQKVSAALRSSIARILAPRREVDLLAEVQARAARGGGGGGG